MPTDQSIKTGLNLKPSLIRKILIIQTAFPGDVILTTPLIAALKQEYPDACIDFLTTPLCANLPETHPDLHQVIIFDKRHRHRGLLNLIHFARNRLRTAHYDLAVIPHRSFRSAAMAWIAQIPHRVGFDRSAGRFLFTQVIKYQKQLHEVERNISLLAPSQIVPFAYPPKIFPTEQDRQIISRFFQEQAISVTFPMIAIAPGSVWETKKWLKTYFAELCSLIHRKYQALIFLIGGASDQILCEWIRENSDANVLNTAGRFTFRQSAELISRCQLLICNDSAPLHLGVAAQIPVMAIFGPTVPAIGFYPYGKKHIIIEKTLDCRPCAIHGGDKCPINTFECMKGITPETVFNAVKRQLSSD